ncbi:DUF2917 domain-containing protein [Usitatibacter palustris]|uniref:DUF2917 domain-containing protein n=1 Tax=Usitatibacter palustris TaxID=2732487 RepID=A0A6M4H4A1_9PROT|nr:DUF2917 domain-containing protein [Usitatibacter palustris]QJR14112.1 hypothetical protein DSM104440_00905 [Usitatibacter palustris]
MDVSLAPGQFVTLEHGRGVEICVAQGRLWITEESRLDDIWLSAGESASLHGDGRALIEAVDASRVHIEKN